MNLSICTLRADDLIGVDARVLLGLEAMLEGDSAMLSVDVANRDLNDEMVSTDAETFDDEEMLDCEDNALEFTVTVFCVTGLCCVDSLSECVILITPTESSFFSSCSVNDCVSAVLCVRLSDESTDLSDDCDSLNAILRASSSTRLLVPG
jgi:hypothetical protein